MAQVYTMRDLNPMHFFRNPAPDAKPDASQASKDGAAGQKKPMTKVPSLLFDIEVSHTFPSWRCLESVPDVDTFDLDF
jgi:hypothetical protein